MLLGLLTFKYLIDNYIAVLIFPFQAETDVFGCQVEPTGSVVNVKDGWNPLPNYNANQRDATQEGICQHDAAYNGGIIRCK